MTRRQKQLLDYIRGYQQANNGVPPSFDEMKAAMGLASKSGIHRLVMALEESGYLRRLPHRARAIEALSKSERPLLQAAITAFGTTLAQSLVRVSDHLSVYERDQINSAFLEIQQFLTGSDHLLGGPPVPLNARAIGPGEPAP